MDANLKIDDRYFNVVGTRCKIRGRELDTEQILKTYIQILESIRSEAIVQGSTADALQAYIACAKSIQGQLSTFSAEIKLICDKLIQDIDQADKEFF